MIRKARKEDLGRIAEIFVFNNRINFFPIFKDEIFSFNELQVIPLVDNYFSKEEIINNLYVYDDNVIKGFVQINKKEIVKLYIDPIFQGKSYGCELINFCIKEFDSNFLWALEKNVKARKFYNRHGFIESGEKKLEEDTTEYLLKLERKK